MTEKFTTIRVYESDRAALAVTGLPTHEAVKRVLQTNCVHPEARRSYVTAVISYPSKKAEKPVGGFYCAHCGRYVFVREVKK